MAISIAYNKGVVICHGKSEVCMVKYIYTNLHLPIQPYSNHNGKNSIQITSLKTLLNAPPFDNINNLRQKYEIEVKGKGKKQSICNFKLFIIMDTDDCTEQQKNDYISKELFKNHWLYDYIVPIYNIKNLEEVLIKSKIMTKKIKTGEKGEYYEQIFPINNKPLSNDTLNEVLTLSAKIKNVKTTNLNKFIEYCVSLVEKYK